MLAGCQGDGEESVLEFTPTPRPTSSSGWDQRAKPERPQDVKSEQGLRAYIDYLALVTPYTLATHDTSVLASLGDPATCVPCRRATDFTRWYGDDVVLYEDRPVVKDVDATKEPARDARAVETRILLPASRRIDTAGGEVRSEQPERTLAVTYDVTWVAGRWQLIDYAPS